MCMKENTTPNASVRGIRNNNPFNIRKGSSWKGERPNQSDPAFEEFTSMEMGIRAGLKLIRNHISGFGGKRKPMNSIAKLIAVWAPPTENNTVEYVRTVSRLSGIPKTRTIFPDDRRSILAIAKAMTRVESGVDLSMTLFESAYDLL